MLYVVAVARTRRGLFHPDQCLQSHEPRNHSGRQLASVSRRVLLIERKRLGDEDIHWGLTMLVSPELEQVPALVPDPGLPDDAVGELVGADRHRRTITEGRQRLERPLHVGRVETDHQVNIVRQPEITVRRHGEAAGHQVPNAGALQLGSDRFDTRNPHVSLPELAASGPATSAAGHIGNASLPRLLDSRRGIGYSAVRRGAQFTWPAEYPI